MGTEISNEEALKNAARETYGKIRVFGASFERSLAKLWWYFADGYRGFDLTAEQQAAVNQTKVEDLFGKLAQEFEELDIENTMNELDLNMGELINQDACQVDYSENSSPVLDVQCPEEIEPGQEINITLNFFDPEADVVYVASRDRIIFSNCEIVETEWNKTELNSSQKCASLKTASVEIPKDMGEGIFQIDYFLIDKEKHHSEIVTCTVYDKSHN